MMKRREFGQKLATAAIGASVAGASAASAQGSRTPRTNTLMHLGGDYHSVAGPRITSRDNLEYNLRYGVKHLTVQARNRSEGGGWDLDALKSMKDSCDQNRVQLEAIRMEPSYITLPKGADRDREIDFIIGNIQKASEVGVKILTYHWTVIPIRRNRETSGRGRVTYSGFKLEDNWKDLPVGKSGKVSSEDYWERITYFLERVIPAAKQHGVRLACHPYDPPGLPFGYQGADNWDSPSIFDSIKRYESIVDSPYNGFQLCLGTTAEGLKNPATGVLPIVQYLGERGKIYQIHCATSVGASTVLRKCIPTKERWTSSRSCEFFETPSSPVRSVPITCRIIQTILEACSRLRSGMATSRPSFKRLIPKCGDDTSAWSCSVPKAACQV